LVFLLLLRGTISWDCCRICLNQAFPDLDTTYHTFGDVPVSPDEEPYIRQPTFANAPPTSFLEESVKQGSTTTTSSTTSTKTKDAPIDPRNSFSCCNICESNVGQTLDNILRIQTTMDAARFDSFKTTDPTATLPPCCDFCVEQFFAQTVELSPRTLTTVGSVIGGLGVVGAAEAAAAAAAGGTNARTTVVVSPTNNATATPPAATPTAATTPIAGGLLELASSLNKLQQRRQAIKQRQGQKANRESGKNKKWGFGASASVSFSAPVSLSAAASLSATASSVLNKVKSTVSSVVSKITAAVKKVASVVSAVANIAGSLSASFSLGFSALPLPQPDIPPPPIQAAPLPPPPAATIPPADLGESPPPCCHRCTGTAKPQR